MPSAATMTAYLGAALLLAAMPGPGLFFIAGPTLRSGRISGFAACGRSALGGLAHVVAGAMGVSALLMASSSAFLCLRLVGSLYLIWLGIRAWRSSDEPMSFQRNSTGPDGRRAFRQGILVEATNPKTAAFFLALIPQFVDASRGEVASQFMALGLTSIGLNTAMAAVVVCTIATARRRMGRDGQAVRRLRRGSAGALGGFGVSVLVSRHPI